MTFCAVKKDPWGTFHVEKEIPRTKYLARYPWKGTRVVQGDAHGAEMGLPCWPERAAPQREELSAGVHLEGTVHSGACSGLARLGSPLGGVLTRGAQPCKWADRA